MMTTYQNGESRSSVDDNGYNEGAQFASPLRRRQKKSSRVQRFLVDHINLGVVGVGICLTLIGAGLACRLYPEAPREFHRDAGRFFLSCGIFGLASALSNFVAVKVLLLTLFLSRHESVLQASVQDIVMNIFFTKEAVEPHLVAHVRKGLSTTTNVVQTIGQILTTPEFDTLIEKYLKRLLYQTPEGLMMTFAGLSKEKLKPLVLPAMVTLVSDVLPVLSTLFEVKDVVSMDAVFDVLERIVSHRAESLNIRDLKGIVSGVLGPHLSILVLWGSVFGILLGAAAEALSFSYFLSGCVATAT